MEDKFQSTKLIAVTLVHVLCNCIVSIQTNKRTVNITTASLYTVQYSTVHCYVQPPIHTACTIHYNVEQI
jgi:hypothetical protein